MVDFSALFFSLLVSFIFFYILYVVIRTGVRDGILLAQAQKDTAGEFIDKIAQTTCLQCGNPHDIDLPKCPQCGHQNFSL